MPSFKIRLRSINDTSCRALAYDGLCNGFVIPIISTTALHKRVGIVVDCSDIAMGSLHFSCRSAIMWSIDTSSRVHRFDIASQKVYLGNDNTVCTPVLR
jgi:hypothetical protein